MTTAPISANDVQEAAICIKQFGNVFRAFERAGAVLKMLQGFEQAKGDHDRRVAEFAENRKAAGRAEAEEIVGRARQVAEDMNRRAQERQKELSIEVRDLRAEASRLKGEIEAGKQELAGLEQKIAAITAALKG